MSLNKEFKDNELNKYMSKISTTQWTSFLKSLFNILRNEGLNITGKNALNEITNLLMLVFIEDKYEIFNKNALSIRLQLREEDKFKNIYLDIKNKLEKYKNDLISKKDKENDIYANLWDILYNDEYHLKTKIEGKKKQQEVNEDLLSCLFTRFSMHPYLKKLISAPADSSKQKPSMSDITSFTNSINKVMYGKNIYHMMELIYDKFYQTDKEGKMIFNLASLSIDFDHLGEAWEKELVATGDTDKSKNGEFFTRRDLCNDIINEINPKKEHKILDPACGSGGMLIGIISRIKEQLKEQYGNNTNKINEEYLKYVQNNVYGIEIRAEGFKNLCLNLILHDTTGEILNNMLLGSSLDFTKNKHYSNSIDCIVANHPYGKGNKDAPIYAIRDDGNHIVSLEEEDLESDTSTKQKKPSIKNAFTNLGKEYSSYWNCILNKDMNLPAENTPKFMMYYYNTLKIGGKAGIVSDRGFLINGTDRTDNMNKRLRQFLLTNCNLYKLWLLPTGIFTHTSFATCVCFFEKGKQTKEVEFVELYFKEEDKGKGNKKYYFKPGFKVTIDKIKKNNWSLNVEDYLPKEKGLNTQQFNIPVEWKKLGDVGTFLPKSKRHASYGKETGKYPFFTSSYNIKRCDTADYNDECLIVGTGGNINVKISSKFSCSADNIVIDLKNKNKYCYYLLRINNNFMSKGFKGSGIGHISKDYLQKMDLPIPTNQQDQDKIVEFCDFLFDDADKPDFIPEMPKRKYDLEIVAKYCDGNELLKHLFNEKYISFVESIKMAHRVNDLREIPEEPIFNELNKRNNEDFYLNTFLKKEWEYITKDVEMEEVKLGDVGKIVYGKRITVSNNSKDKTDIYNVPVYGGGGITFYTKEQNRPLDNEQFTIIIGRFGVSEKCVRVVNSVFFLNDSGMSFHSNINVMKYILQLKQKDIFSVTKGSGQQNMDIDKLKNILLPIPTNPQDQDKIVNYLDEKMELHKKYWEHLKKII